MPGTCRKWLLSALLPLVSTGTVEAQERDEIRVATPLATLESQTIARLSFAGLDIAPHVAARVFRLSDGGWGVSSSTFSGVVQTFDAGGKPGESFGKSGEGPGEFAGEVFGIGNRDALWIVDPGNARLSAFSEDFTLLYDRSLPGRVFFVSRSDDDESIWATGFFDGPGRGHSIARLSRNDDRDVLGGAVGNSPNTRLLVHIPAQIADEVWTIAVSGGAVDVLRSSDLTVIARLRFSDESMTRVAVEGRRNPDEPPPSQVAGTMVDENGRLWVIVGVADRDWRPGISPRDGIHRLLDTRIIVIDPRSRTVVAEGRLPELCMPVEHRILSCVDELGEEIHIVELSPKPQHGRSGT